MPGYQTHIRIMRLVDRDYGIRSPGALQQFAEPDCTAPGVGPAAMPGTPQ